MKRFQFRLQRVLEYRQTLSKQSERELALKNAELHEAREDLEMILGEQDRAEDVAEGVTTMAELSVRGNYYEALQQSLIKQRELVAEAAQAVEMAREVYREKAREVKSLDTLKDKRKAEHREAVKKDERKQLDNLVVQRHRFSKEGG